MYAHYQTRRAEGAHRTAINGETESFRGLLATHRAVGRRAASGTAWGRENYIQAPKMKNLPQAPLTVLQALWRGKVLPRPRPERGQGPGHSVRRFHEKKQSKHRLQL